MTAKRAWTLAGVLGAVLGACAAPQIAPSGALALGQTPEQVEQAYGQPNQRIVRQTEEYSVEIWSYERPYKPFSLDDCGYFTAHKLTVQGHEIEGRQCRERARVVFSQGKVVAFETKQGATY